MSRPPPTVNGISLEDCFTNLFALADLEGIRWCKLIAPQQSDQHQTYALQDPILKAYNRCISREVLCVWRRCRDVRQDIGFPNIPKELWVFWYKDQPQYLQAIRLELKLHEAESGHWERSQLPYQCRTLLFKAIHNLIERHLLLQKFVRIGKWFVVPYDQDSLQSQHKVHFSFSFSFFLHGQSTVCASVDVRQHPILHRLHLNHLLLAQQDQTQIKVILAPFGLSAGLSGSWFRYGDQKAFNQLNIWREHFVIDDSYDRDDLLKPALVEVIVSGVKLKYPFCMVLTEQAPKLSIIATLPPILAFSPPCTPCPSDQTTQSSFSILAESQGTSPAKIGIDGAKNKGQLIISKAFEDSTLTPIVRENNNQDENATLWDYVDSTSKSQCCCSNRRNYKSPDSSSKKHRNRTQQRLPFHTRAINDNQQTNIPIINEPSYSNNSVMPPSQSNHHPPSVGPSTPYTVAKTPIQQPPSCSSIVAPPTPTPPFSASSNQQQPITPVTNNIIERSPYQPMTPKSPTKFVCPTATMPILREFLPDETYEVTNFDDIDVWLKQPLKRLKKDYGEYDNDSMDSPSPKELLPKLSLKQSPQPFDVIETEIKNEQPFYLTQADLLENLFDTDDSMSPKSTTNDDWHSHMDSIYPTPPDSVRTSQDQHSPNSGNNFNHPHHSEDGIENGIYSNSLSHNSSSATMYNNHLNDTVNLLSKSVCQWPIANRFDALKLTVSTQENLTLPKYISSPPQKKINHHHQQQQQQLPNANTRLHFNTANSLTPTKYIDNNRVLQSPASNSSQQHLYRSKTYLSEADPIMINVMLSDSLLNIFKDHNFDSCPVCVCNMNIRGSDYESSYLNVNYETGREIDQTTCVCGFSAIMNRRYAISSGLFREDQLDICSNLPSLLNNRKDDNLQSDALSNDINWAIRQYFSSGKFHMSCVNDDIQEQTAQILELQDGYEICWQSIHFSLLYSNSELSHTDQAIFKEPLPLHQWPYLQKDAKIPANYHEMLRLFNALNPLLQEAVQKKSNSWDITYNVMGPLTWKDFHLLSRQGTDESSAPQPIPQFVTGYEKELISVSPYSLLYWDKLLMEPYNQAKNIIYVALCPDPDYITENVASYLCELSSVYESCKLGSHRPISCLRDGLLRVGKNIGKEPLPNLDNEMEAWLKTISDTKMASKLAIYAKLCKSYLWGLLKSENDKWKENLMMYVVYIIDPFSSNNWDGVNRTATLGFFRCFEELRNICVDDIKSRLSFQIIPQQDILASKLSADHNELKSLAWTVYADCYKMSTYNINGRSLTGFGPAAEANRFLSNFQGKKELLHKPSPSSRPFILSSNEKRWASSDTDTGNVLLVAYCLSDDQKWLLASITDGNGELMETCNINIYVPAPNFNNRQRLRCRVSARKYGLKKLWNFIRSVIGSTLLNWRVVIGRLGRLGHGELKGWAGLLSRDNLAKTNNELKENCKTCLNSSKHFMPSSISCACLVSMESHHSIRVMAEAVKNEETSSTNVPLNTPQDASTTHILVLPTSATAMHQAPAGVQQLDVSDDDLMNAIGSGDIDDESFGFNFEDLFSNIATTSPGGNQNDQLSPNQNILHQSMNMASNNVNAAESDPQDMFSNIPEQPIAIGFYLSTAPTGQLPSWFWSTCPQRANLSPVCLKSMLHLHNIIHHTDSDEYGTANKTSNHPLDSNLTPVVLRYVLETYNSLSWLTFDCNRNERRSCLPIHFVVLMQIYNAVNKLV